MRIHIIPLAILLLAGCDRTDDRSNTQKTDQQKPPAPVVVNDRDRWQEPEELFTLLEGGLKGATIADLFAGDGYFTFKLIEKGANVIAIESDPAKIASLENRKKELGLSDQQLQIRSVNAGEPGLKPNEADLGLIVHSYGSIPERASYVQKLREGLKEPRQLYLIEWQYRETPVGPPISQRIPTEQIMEELGLYGFSGVGAKADLMPYQVILFAMDEVEMSEEQYQMQMEGLEVNPM